MIKLFREFETWEIHHKIAAFNLILVATIFTVRTAVIFYNPNPVVLNFELHHFDYGIILLFITCLLLLFHRRNSHLYLIMAAVAFGLILDELWFVRGNINRIAEIDISFYNASLFSALIFAKVVTIATLLIDHFRNKRKEKLALKPVRKLKN